VGKGQLLVTTDGGKSYSLVGNYSFRRESGRIATITYKAPHEGEFGFFLVTEDQYGKRTPKKVDGMEPMTRVVVDTVPPKIQMIAYEEPAGKVMVAWEVTDANLDPDTMRLEYRPGNEKEWKELSKPLSAKGTCLLKPTADSWEVRMRAADKAGNVGETTMKYPPGP
jgi:hypothetical protein